jgi:uncharacterized protein YjbJ (UPF0337 family)
MSQSTNDRIEGAIHGVKGKVKVTAGQAENLGGKVQKKAGQVEQVFEN